MKLRTVHSTAGGNGKGAHSEAKQVDADATAHDEERCGTAPW